MRPLARHPTLTRLWCRKGRREQRRIEAPGRNQKAYGFGMVDWRDGWFAGQLAPGRTAAAFRARVRAVVARSRARGRVVIAVGDILRTHMAAGARRVRQMLADLDGQPHVVSTPAYDPDANRIEWLCRVSRRAVTHNHQRRDFATLCTDAEAHVRDLAAHPEAVLAHIGSPGCPRLTPQSPTRGPCCMIQLDAFSPPARTASNGATAAARLSRRHNRTNGLLPPPLHELFSI